MSHKLDPHRWAHQLAIDATTAEEVNHGDRSESHAGRQAATPESREKVELFEDYDDRLEERPEFETYPVTVLEVSSANRHHAEGEPVAVMTISRETEIEALCLSLRDARLTATRLLAALATADDPFATKMLHENFPADAEGEFIWPRDAGHE